MVCTFLSLSRITIEPIRIYLDKDSLYFVLDNIWIKLSFLSTLDEHRDYQRIMKFLRNLFIKDTKDVRNANNNIKLVFSKITSNTFQSG